jgi:hypothetical protein
MWVGERSAWNQSTRIGIDFQADGQRRLRRDSEAYAAFPGAENSFVELEGAAPERLASERVVAEYLLPVREHCLRVTGDLASKLVARGAEGPAAKAIMAPLPRPIAANRAKTTIERLMQSSLSRK